MESAAQVLDSYGAWLDRQALAPRTRTAYRRWVAELLEHLVAGGELDAFLAPTGEDDRRALLGDWRRRLVDRRLAPSTVNLALAAATSQLDSRALRAPAVRRVEVDPKRRGRYRMTRSARCSARPIGSRPAAIARSCSC